jgi:ectoine hydroxylase-related dioxygenase (phytanoyl-CoA dioxygenase family)
LTIRHSDGPHMSLTSDLPCHCLNIFIPLIDIDEYNGPTEIKPGSHHYTRDLAKSMLIALIKKQIRPSIAPCLTKGSALLVS